MTDSLTVKHENVRLGENGISIWEITRYTNQSDLSEEIPGNLLSNLLQNVVGEVQRLSGGFLTMHRKSHAEVRFTNAAAHHFN